jgi:hypothetical protein
MTIQRTDNVADIQDTYLRGPAGIIVAMAE